MQAIRFTGAGMLGIILLLMAGSVRAALSHDSAHQWYTLEGENFLIHYHDGAENIARQLLPYAEQVHAELSVYLHWQPQGPVEIVLSDEVDFSNGYATFFPANRTTLYLTPPDEVDGLEDHAGWLELVFRHEYLHILHLDKASGFPSTLRKLFGRFILFFPNALQPNWVTEGLATYIETDRERGIGRGQSSYYDMLMRMETLAGIKPLRQTNQPLVSWPMGQTPYLYGVHYLQFLDSLKGPDDIATWVDEYSDNLIPYRINSTSRAVYGYTLSPMWRDFETYLREKFATQIQQVQQEGVSPQQRLSFDGYFLGPLQGNGDALYYVAYDTEHASALWRKPLQGSASPQRLLEVPYGSRFDVHPQAGVLLARLEYCNNAALYYDLYILEHGTGQPRRISHCGRYRQATWSPGGQQIAAVKNTLGSSSLQLLDTEGRVLRNLWQGEGGTVIGGMDWSPDGAFLVVSAWLPGSGWDLYRIDLADGQWQRLTFSRAIETQPLFSADGRTVLFSADTNGIYNIHRLELDSGRLGRLTNVMGGAFSPASVSGQEKLYYVGYGRDGFDLYSADSAQEIVLNDVAGVKDSYLPGVLSLDRTAGQLQLGMMQEDSHILAEDSHLYPEPLGLLQSRPQQRTYERLARAAEAEPSARFTTPLAADRLAPVRDYAPYAGLRPRWWLPLWDFSEQRSLLGFTTSAWDSLQRHSYALTLAYDSSNEWTEGSLDYIYDRWYPILKLHIDRSYELALTEQDELQGFSRDTTAMAEMHLPLIRYDWQSSLILGLAYEQQQVDGYYAPLVKQTFHDIVAGAALSFNNSRRYPRSISRSDGRNLLWVSERSVGASDYSGAVHTLDWKEYLRLYRQQVLAVQAVAAVGEEQTHPFELGGVFGGWTLPGYLDSPLAGSPFKRRSYPLRGYAEGLAELRGHRMGLLSLEYRFPLALVERGIMAPPVGLHQLHGRLFADQGWIGSEGEDSRAYGGLGAELGLDTVLFYELPMALTLGFAQGLDGELGEQQYYVRLGGAF